MKINEEISFNSQARMAFKVFAEDVQNDEDKAALHKEVVRLYGLQTKLIETRMAAVAAAGVNKKKRGRKKKSEEAKT